MLKRLNGFKKFYLFSLVLALFWHFWTCVIKRETESNHVFSLIFSFILLLFFGFMLNMSISMSPNTIIPPIYHNARMEGNYVIIDHGSYEHGIGSWSVYRTMYHKLVNPIIMEL